MDVAVLYSGGKDSSLIATILSKLNLNPTLITANFGVYDSYIPAKESAENLGFKHEVFSLNKEILEDAAKIILKDNFPNNGINYIHKAVLESAADKYDIIADGTRRDDRVPKLTKNEIKSIEDRKSIQYINLDSFGHKSIKYLSSSLFDIIKQKSNKENSSDYEVEIRLLINELKGEEKTKELFPEHYQTRVVGFKDNNKSKEIC